MHRRGRGPGEPGHPLPGRRLQVLGAAPGRGRRAGLAALADLGRAGRDLRQPGRHQRAAHPGALQHQQGEEVRTGRPPRLVRGQRRRHPPGRGRRGRPARGARHRVRRQRHDGLDRPAPHPARGRPAGRVAAGVRRGGPADPGLLLGARACAASTGTRSSTSTARWSNGSPPPTSSPTCCARYSANSAPRTPTSRPPAATRAPRTTSAGRACSAPTSYCRDDGWTVRRILPGDSSDSKARSPLAGTGIREGAVLTHVDGRPVDPVTGPYPLLAGAGGTTVELTFTPAEGEAGRRPARGRRPADRRAPAALPGLGRQTPRRGARVERRPLRLPAHPGHGRLRLGPVQPRPAHGGVAARADRRRARQRGRTHQRAGRREADPHDPGLGPHPRRPAGVVRLATPRAARSSPSPTRRPPPTAT